MNRWILNILQRWSQKNLLMDQMMVKKERGAKDDTEELGLSNWKGGRDQKG